VIQLFQGGTLLPRVRLEVKMALHSKNLNVFRSIVKEFDATLFEKIHRQTHCLHLLLPIVKPSSQFTLRGKGHPYS
jgi:hypothetical protein